MAAFSENQVRHLYVAKALSTSNVTVADTAGTIAVKSDTAKSHMYLEVKGAKSDNLTRSDLIDIKDILYAKATDASKLAYNLKSYLVTLDADVNSGAPVSGEDYILRILFRKYIGMSDDTQTVKYGMVHAYSGMTASNFYKILAVSLAKNFSRELEPLLAFKLKTATGSVDVIGTTNVSTLTDTYTGVIINEVQQEWVLGTKQQVNVDFDIEPSVITFDCSEVIWGTVSEQPAAGVINDGHNIADLEYFLMGERGDIYRNISFPYIIPTQYLVDPSVAYNIIDIHYAYTGSNEGVQKSEKTLSIAVPKVGATNSVSNVLTNSIISAINTATGLSISTLGVETE